MTHTLILIRHAKSDWGDAGLPDHDRPLNERGRRAAPCIGAFLTQNGLEPAAVLCSTARRTQETWAGVSAQLLKPVEPILSRGLYGAMPADIMAAIRHADASPLAVIGHNPGIGSLAWSLSAAPPDHEKFDLYPTGATTVLEFDITDWAEVSPGQGELRHFVVPRDLPDPS